MQPIRGKIPYIFYWWADPSPKELHLLPTYQPALLVFSIHTDPPPQK